MTLRVGIYTRLSRDMTGKQTATARQEKSCRAFADLRGWEVAEVFEDVDLSAYQRGVVRPSYERMVKAVSEGLSFPRFPGRFGCGDDATIARGFDRRVCSYHPR